MSVTAQPTPGTLELPPGPVRRFTVEEYHRMIAAGVFAEDERSELLEGWIVPKMTRNPYHEAVIDATQEAIRKLLPEGWRLRTQSPTSTLDSEPEPDVAVAKGSLGDFVSRHPGP